MEEQNTTVPDGTGAASPDGVAGTGADALREELKKLVAQRDKLKATLREIEPLAEEGKRLKQAQMSELEKAQARLKELEPLATQAQALTEELEATYASEVSSIPEDMRGLIVGGSIAERLKWVRQAKGKGLFVGVGSVGGQLPAGEKKASITMAELGALAKSDLAAWEQKQTLIKQGKLALV